jgi:hypothetical protein
MRPEAISTRSLRRACGAETPNTDSPHIPHDKVAKMTDSCHMALSEGHHHPPAASFESSLSFSRECAPLARERDAAHLVSDPDRERGWAVPQVSPKPSAQETMSLGRGRRASRRVAIRPHVAKRSHKSMRSSNVVSRGATSS